MAVYYFDNESQSFEAITDVNSGDAKKDSQYVHNKVVPNIEFMDLSEIDSIT